MTWPTVYGTTIPVQPGKSYWLASDYGIAYGLLRSLGLEANLWRALFDVDEPHELHQNTTFHTDFDSALKRWKELQDEAPDVQGYR